MPGRKYSAASGYRYGFNGKEMDNEVASDGNQYDYGFRIYNPRIGKFLSVDPLAKSYPWNSSFAYAEGDVIRSIDLDGAEKKIQTLNTGSLKVSIQKVNSEAPPLALQQAKQRAMYEDLDSTPEQKEQKELAATMKWAGNNQATINQGGLLGSPEYRIFKGRMETYGVYMPGPGDIVDAVTALRELSNGNYKAAALSAFFLIPGADVFKPIKSLKGVGGDLLEGYIKKLAIRQSI